MGKFAFIGFGDLGNYVRDTILDFQEAGAHSLVYFDDNLAASGDPDAKPFASYVDDEYADYDFYICLGYRHLSLKGNIINKLLSLGRSVPHFVHPSSYVHPTVKLGPGSWIYPGCSIDRNTVIGLGSWIANGDVIPHDCHIGECCWFGASVTLSGKVHVGNRTFIGSGSVVSNALQIGSDVIIGLGSVITKSVADQQSVIGSPMRILENKIQLI